MTDKARPGAVLKSLRLRQGWTLQDLSDKTGFLTSTLSKMENDKVSMTYDKVSRLSEIMGVDIGVFFAQGEASHSSSGRRSIVRKNDGSVFETETYHHRFVAHDLLNKRFVPIIAEVYARSIDEFEELPRHSGEEYTYILEGVVEVHTELYAPVRLEAGESIYFDSGMPHAYINVGPGRCRGLTICSADEAHLKLALHKDGMQRRKVAVEAPKRKAADAKKGKKARPRKTG